MIRESRPWNTIACPCTGPRGPYHDWDVPKGDLMGMMNKYVRCLHCPVRAFSVGAHAFQELSVTIIEWP